MTDLRTQAGSSFRWAAASFVGSRLVVFLTTLVLARLLSPTDFGVVAAGMTVVIFLEMGLDLGVAAAIVYEQERGITRRVQTAFTLNAILSGCLTGIGVALAPLVAAFFDLGEHESLFRVLPLYLLIRGLGQVSDGVLRRDLRFRERTIVDIVRSGVRAGVSVPLAATGAGPSALVAGLLAGELAATVGLWAVVRLRPSFTLDRDAARTLLRFGVPSTLMRVVNEVSTNADYLVVGNRLGATTLGYYSIAFRLPELLIGNVMWVFSTVAFPLFSRVRTHGQAALRRTMLRAVMLTGLYGFAVGAFLAVASRDAVHVLFSTTWAPAAVPMALLSLAIGISALGYASGDIFSAVGRPGTLLAINVPVSIAMIAGYVIAAPHGITAVAAVHLVVSAFYVVVRLAVANRLVDASWGPVLRALRAPVVVTSCLVAASLPVRLITDPGIVGLTGVTAAAAAGVAIGLALSGRAAREELRLTLRTVLGRQP